MFAFLPLDSLQHVIFDLLTVLIYLIVADIIISNMICFGVRMSRFHHLVRFVRSTVDPLVNPIRRLLPHPGKTGNLDFAPMIAMIIVQAIRNSLV